MSRQFKKDIIKKIDFIINESKKNKILKDKELEKEKELNEYSKKMKNKTFFINDVFGNIDGNIKNEIEKLMNKKIKGGTIKDNKYVRLDEPEQNQEQTMSEKYDQIIQLVDKYYYFIASAKKIIMLSSSNDLEEAEHEAISKLEPNIEKFIGKKLIFVKIINTYDKFKKEKKNKDNLSLVPGPLAFEFLFGSIDNKKKYPMKKNQVIINITYQKNILKKI